jgi:hypothetical protein
MNVESLDRTDILILRELQKDAKLTTKELAAKVNLSPSPVFERQKRLEREVEFPYAAPSGEEQNVSGVVSADFFKDDIFAELLLLVHHFAGNAAFLRHDFIQIGSCNGVRPLVEGNFCKEVGDVSSSAGKVAAVEVHTVQRSVSDTAAASARAAGGASLRIAVVAGLILRRAFDDHQTLFHAIVVFTYGTSAGHIIVDLIFGDQVSKLFIQFL